MKRLLIAVALAGSAPMLGGQAPFAPAFDVAAIKPNISGEQQFAGYVQPGGRYIATNITLRMLLVMAWGVHDSQIVGGPTWMNTDRWDVTAKAEGYAEAAPFRDRARLMLRPLMADRFKVVLRRDRRELPVYALVVAKPNGELGRQFRRNEERPCTGAAPPLQPAEGAPEPGVRIACGGDMFRPGHLAARAMTLTHLIVALTRFTDRVVVDRTGLSGTFDWEIQWIPEDLRVDAKPLDGPSLFDAFREQAGLKLEPSHDRVDVLIVDRAERPETD